MIRTHRKKPYHSVLQMVELTKKLPTPTVVLCDWYYIVNLNCVWELISRNPKDSDFPQPTGELLNSHRLKPV